MGIISDTLEDNRERFGQLLTAPLLSVLEAPIGPTSVLGCPICSDLLKDEGDLQRHILSRHCHLLVYVKLNGCISPDVAFVDQPVTQLTTVLLGDAKGSVKLMLDDSQPIDFTISPGKPIAFEKRISAQYVGKIEIRITIGKAERDFVIYCRTQPPLQVQELDEAVWSLQEPLLEGHEPDWSRFQRERLGDRSGTALETRYLEGLYSYLLGCYLETQRSPQAGRHLEEALGRLRPFASTMAHTARCVLAIKLNAFRLLKDCRKDSRFFEGNLFFNGDREPAQTRGVRKAILPACRGLWIDGFLEQLLDAISCFFADRLDQVEKGIADMRRSPYCEEQNNWDKVTLLQARTAHALHQGEAAKKAYTRLLHHPLFGREAKRYCE